MIGYVIQSVYLEYHKLHIYHLVNHKWDLCLQPRNDNGDTYEIYIFMMTIMCGNDYNDDDVDDIVVAVPLLSL